MQFEAKFMVFMI